MYVIREVFFNDGSRVPVTVQYSNLIDSWNEVTSRAEIRRRALNKHWEVSICRIDVSNLQTLVKK